MLTALDIPDDKLDQAERSFVASIREHGWFRTTVHGDEEGPGFVTRSTIALAESWRCERRLTD